MKETSNGSYQIPVQHSQFFLKKEIREHLNQLKNLISQIYERSIFIPFFMRTTGLNEIVNLPQINIQIINFIKKQKKLTSMQANSQKILKEKQNFYPVFPIQFNAQQNIYILTENSFANKFIELSIGNKVQNLAKQNYTWYLHPQEAFYLISVWPYSSEEQEKYRKSFILRIYKNSQPQDIQMIHFYLNLRKRNKFCRRIDKFSLNSTNASKQGSDKHKNSEEKQEISQIIQNYRIFKVYQTLEDYKNDQNYNFYLLVQTKSKISKILFNPDLNKIKQAFQIFSFHMCIIQNNDFIVTQINSF